MSDEQSTTRVASLEDALGRIDFDLCKLNELLEDAHELRYGERNDAEHRVELTFRVKDPSHHRVDHYNLKDGEWMQYECSLTGMWAVVPMGSPVPIFLLWDRISADHDWGLVEDYLIHPDFLADHGKLRSVIVSALHDEIKSGLFTAKKALGALRALDEEDDVPGLATEGVSYPNQKGYEALGNRRPVPPEDSQEDD